MNSLSWMELVVGSLVTFRIATMFTQESGPGKVFKKVRNAPSNATFREGLRCPYCFSLYASTFVATAFTLLGWLDWKDALFASLAFSGVSVVMTRQWTKDL